MDDAIGVVVSLFVLAVTVGALVQFVSHPTEANTLIAASTDTITGITQDLEGKNPK